jgi:prolyl-tRNA synthetase
VKIENLIEDVRNLGAEFDARLREKADEFFEKRIVECSDKASIKKALDSGKIARFSFCSDEKEGASCAEFIEKELQARVMGVRADKNEKAKGKCPFCGKKATVVVYAGKSY